MAAQAQQPSGDNSFAPLWIMLICFGSAYIVWITAHQYIVQLVFSFNLIQAELVHLVTGNQLLGNEIYIMKTVNPKSVDWEQLVFLTRSVGQFTRYPLVVILVSSAFILYRSDVTLRYRRAHDMKSLALQEQRNWPAIMPILKEDLVSMDINIGPWAMALTPMEFARKHQLLRKDDELLDKSIPGLEMTAGLRRGDAKRVFTLQLGPYWDGFDRTPPYVQALAAVFMARMNRDRSSATKILEMMDIGSVSGKMDYSFAKSVLRKYQNTEIVQDVISKHAYLLTVMSSLIQAARMDGVVPSSEFLWLKPVDRRLWYVLNSIGRQTAYAEVGGVFAHWKAEQRMRRRSLVPMIDEAIKALEVAIKEIKLSEKELQELQP